MRIIPVALALVLIGSAALPTRAAVFTVAPPVSLAFALGTPAVGDTGDSASASTDGGVAFANAAGSQNYASAAGFSPEPASGNTAKSAAYYLITLNDPLHPSDHTPGAVSMHIVGATEARDGATGGWSVQIGDQACFGPIYVSDPDPSYLDGSFDLTQCTYHVHANGFSVERGSGEMSGWSAFLDGVDGGAGVAGVDDPIDRSFDLSPPVNTSLVVQITAGAIGFSVAVIDPIFSVGAGNPGLVLQVTAPSATTPGLPLDGAPRARFEAAGFDLARFEQAGLISAPEPSAVALALSALGALALLGRRRA